MPPYEEMCRRYRGLEADLNGTMIVLKRTEAKLAEAQRQIEELTEQVSWALGIETEASAKLAKLRRTMEIIHEISAT